MRPVRFFGYLALCLYSLGVVAAEPIDPNDYVGEHWYGLYITGKKAGYSQSKVTADESGIITVIEDASFKLNMAGIKQNMRVYSKRTYAADGALMTIESKVDDIAGTNRFDAVVEGEELILTSTVGGQEQTRRFPKPAETLQSMVKFTDLLAGDPQPGDTSSFSLFEPMYQMEIEAEVTVLGKELRMLDGVSTDVYSVKTLMKTIGIESIGYVTKDGTTLEDKIAGGIITMRLEPKEVAKDVHYANDTIVSNAAMLETTLEDPRNRPELKLKVTGPLTEEVLFNDERQTFSKRVDSYTFIGKKLSLDVASAPSIPIIEASVAEWQKPTLFVQSDNARLIEKAKSIIGDETNSAKISEALCHWVYKNMKPTFSARLTNSLEVLDNMEGDCTEHSMLFIGLARASGIPAREVAGLIYVEGPKTGFYFHQWARVWVGQWIDVDPTFDQPIADATHIKFAEGDLFEQTKILPVIGQLTIEEIE